MTDPAVADMGRAVTSALESLTIVRRLLESSSGAPGAARRIHQHVLDAEHANELAARIAMSIHGDHASDGLATSDLAEALERALAMVRPLVRPGTSVHAAHVPGVRVAMCRTELVRAVFNVLANAVQSGAGTDQPNHVRLRTETHPDWVAVIVSDSGSGIPPAVLRRLQDSRRAIDPCTGLGSTLALLRRGGGSARFASRPGVGTEVTLRLPRTHEDRAW